MESFHIVMDRHNKKYTLRTFLEEVIITIAEDNFGYEFPYTINGIHLRHQQCESDVLPTLWEFKDGSYAISYRTPQGTRRFVSEMWEICAATRALGLNLCVYTSIEKSKT